MTTVRGYHYLKQASLDQNNLLGPNFPTNFQTTFVEFPAIGFCFTIFRY